MKTLLLIAIAVGFNSTAFANASGQIATLEKHKEVQKESCNNKSSAALTDKTASASDTVESKSKSGRR